MRNMINGGNLVQVGLVLATYKQVLGMWQFNLHFSPSWRAPYHPGVKFLHDKAGINFEQHETRGIPAIDFTKWLSESGLICNSNVDWITFAGCNDFGFLTCCLTGTQLGPDRLQFLNTFRELFPQSYDIRIFTKLGRCRPAVMDGGLSKVCQRLQVQVKIEGHAHNSAYDALCTILCLEKLSRADSHFFTRIRNYCGALYGVSDIHEFDRTQ